MSDTDISHELIEQVKQASAYGKKLKIVGGGSKDFMGRQSEGEPISIAKHSGIVSYEPIELVLTARAGTPLIEINAALAEHHQRLAFEPPLFDGRATLGGTLASHLSGPGRPWNGSIRDHVLGIRLINGRAEELRFGGQVMKNVAGYDVSRMQAGAMGTLGIISEVSLKIMPKPAATITLKQEMNAAQAIAEMNRLAGQAKPLTAACWFDNHLYLRLEGARSAVDSTVTQWQGTVLKDGDDLWAQLREQQLDYFADKNAPLWRFSVNSNAGHLLPEESWLIDWGGSQRWLRGDFATDELEALAESAGGQVSLYRGGDRLQDVFHTQPDALRKLHQRLKQAFDPSGVFNPGRLYSWM
ncbi:glycolate oxidase subunit GlcE [Psychrobacter frigidicola]|uniref:Glycolate oxidase subunit GlcE n=1 Tax=Psychrobacter frigidicola TaxID=45611 RepID=A0A5C7A3A1_9GAMM|nr:glycolate oxidase subunit GlcE [Psychrobacter frigidicola]TXD97871.1 glycolate oxidase subunit GlcE [Psychrobacter frigidicola]